MSISSLANTNAARQWQAIQRPRTSPAPSATTAADSGSGTSNSGTSNSIAAAAGALSGGNAGAKAPYDAIMVALPNGISIGVVHFGSSIDAATEDQMVQSAEQMAGALEGYSGAGAGTQASSNGAAPAGSQGSDATPGGSTDMIQVGLPNGISFEVEHFATGSETDAESKAVAAQMVKAAEDLAAALKAYSGTSSSTAANSASSGLLPPSGLTA